MNCCNSSFDVCKNAWGNAVVIKQFIAAFFYIIIFVVFCVNSFAVNPPCTGNGTYVSSGSYSMTSNVLCNGDLNLSSSNVQILCNGYQITFNTFGIRLENNVNNITFRDCNFANFSINEFATLSNVSFYNTTFDNFTKFNTVFGIYYVYDLVSINLQSVYGDYVTNATVNITSTNTPQISYSNFTTNGYYSQWVLRYGNYSIGRKNFNNFTINISYQGWSNSTSINITSQETLNFISLDVLPPYIVTNVNSNMSNSSMSFVFSTNELANITLFYKNSTSLFWNNISEPLASFFSFNFLNLSSGTWYNFSVNMTDRSNNSNVTYFNFKTWNLYSINMQQSAGISNLSWKGDPENATNFTIISTKGAIVFSNANITKLNFTNTTFVLNNNFVYINDTIMSGLNRSAIINLSVSNVHSNFKIIIYKYTNISFDSNQTIHYDNNTRFRYITNYTSGVGWVLFNVSGFSAYTTQDDSALDVSNHTLVGNYSQDIFIFYANYSRISDSHPINDTDDGGICNITFYDGTFQMVYNQTIFMYVFNRTFINPGLLLPFNITCYSLSNNPIFANDTYNVTTRTIFDYNVSDNGSCSYIGASDCTNDWLDVKSLIADMSTNNENYSVMISNNVPYPYLGWNTTYNLTGWIYIGNNTQVIFNDTNLNQLIVYLPNPIVSIYNSSIIISNYTFPDTIFKHNQNIYFNVMAFVPGNQTIRASNGILFLDNTPPVFNGFLFIQNNLNYFNGIYAFARYSNMFTFSYWIADFESKLSKIQYAFGTSQYNNNGFDSIIPWSNLPIYESNYTNFTITGFNMSEGQYYYLSIYAENNRSTGLNPSHLGAYNSTFPILLDMHPPINGSFNLDNFTNYYDGYSNSINTTIKIFTGQDNNTNFINVSGIAWGVLWYRNATLKNAVCQNDWSLNWTIYNLTQVSAGKYYNLTFNTSNASCYMFNFKLYDYALNYEEFNKTLISDSTRPAMLYLNDPGSSVYYRVSLGANGSVMNISFDAQNNISGINRFQICIDTVVGGCSVYNTTQYYAQGNRHTFYYSDFNFTDGKKYFFNVSSYSNANLDNDVITSLGTVFFLVKVPVNNLTYFQSDATRHYTQLGAVLTDYTDLINWNKGMNTTINVSNMYPYNMTCRWYYNDVAYDPNSGKLCLLNGTQKASCVMDTLVQGDYDVSIACANSNILTVYQLANENMDLHFAYDYNEVPFISSYEYNGQVYNITNNVVNVLEDDNVTVNFEISDNDTHTKFVYNDSLFAQLQNISIIYWNNSFSNDDTNYFNGNVTIFFYNSSNGTNVRYNDTTKYLNISFNSTLNSTSFFNLLINSGFSNFTDTFTDAYAGDQILYDMFDDGNEIGFAYNSSNNFTIAQNAQFLLYRYTTDGVSNSTYFIGINTTTINGGMNISWNNSLDEFGNEVGVLHIDLSKYYANNSGLTPLKLNFSDYLSVGNLYFILNITPVNHAVQLNYSFYANNSNYTFNEDSSIVINMSKYFLDADITFGQFENMTYIVQDANPNLNLTNINNKTGYLNITALPDFYGFVSFTLNATDKGNSTAKTGVINVSVVPIENAPQINFTYYGNNSNVSFYENGTLSVVISKYLYDVDTFYTWNGVPNDTVFYNYTLYDMQNFSVVYFNSSTGTLTINSTNSYFVGNTTLNMSIMDSQGASNLVKLNVSIIFVDSPPYVNSSYYGNNSQIIFDEGTSIYNVGISKYFLDHDLIYGDYLMFNYSSSSNLSIAFSSQTGLFNFSAASNYYGIQSVTFIATDFYNLSVNFTLPVNITPVNHVPYYINMTNISGIFNINQTSNIITVPEDGYISARFNFGDNDTFTQFNYTQNVNLKLQNLTISFNPRSIFGDNMTLRFINDTTVSNPELSYSTNEMNLTFNSTITNGQIFSWINGLYGISIIWTNNSVLQGNATYYFYRNISTGGVSNTIVITAINSSNLYNFSFNASTYDFKWNLSSSFTDLSGAVWFNVNFSDYISSSSFVFGVNVTHVDQPPKKNVSYVSANQTFYEHSFAILNLSRFVYDPEGDSFNITFNNTGSLDSFFNLNNYNFTTFILNLTTANPNACGNQNLTFNATQNSNISLSNLIAIPITVICLNNLPFYVGMSSVNSIINQSSRIIYADEDSQINLTFIIGDNDTFTLFNYSTNNQTTLNNLSITVSFGITGGNLTLLFVNDTDASSIYHTINGSIVAIYFNTTVNNSLLYNYWNTNVDLKSLFTFSTTDPSRLQTQNMFYFDKNITGGISNTTKILSVNGTIFNILNSNTIYTDLGKKLQDQNGLFYFNVNFTDYLVSNLVTFTLNVSFVNQPPRINLSHSDLNTSFNENTMSSFNLQNFLYDPQQNPINIKINLSDNVWVQLLSYDNVSGIVSIVPRNDTFGLFNLTFIASDGTNESLLSVPINITHVNQPPRINITHFYINESTNATINYSQIIYDVDNVTSELNYTLSNLSSYPFTKDLYAVVILAPIIDNDSTIQFNLTAFDGQYYISTLFNVTFISTYEMFTVNPGSIFNYNFIQGSFVTINLSTIFSDDEKDLNLNYTILNVSSPNLLANVLVDSVTFSSSVSGTYNSTLNIFDGVSYLNETFFVTVNSPAPSGGTGGTGGKKGSGGIGGENVVYVPTQNVSKNVTKDLDSYYFGNISSGQSVVLYPRLDFIDSLSYPVYENIPGNFSVTLTEIPAINIYGDISYKAIDVSHNIPAGTYGSGDLRFSIDKSFIKDNDINTSAVKIYLYDKNTGQYIGNPVSFVSEDSQKIHYLFNGINEGKYYIVSQYNYRSTNQEVQNETITPSAPTCFDGLKNDQEGDVDCGGTCTLKCAIGKTCNFNRDCSSNYCLDRVCQEKTNSSTQSTQQKLGFTSSLFFLSFIFIALLAVAIFTVVIATHRPRRIEALLPSMPESQNISFDNNQIENNNDNTNSMFEKETLDKLVAFGAKVIEEHGEDVLLNLLTKRQYPSNIKEYIITNAKKKANIDVVASELKSAEDEYNVNFDNSRKKREELLKIKDKISELKDKLDEYE